MWWPCWDQLGFVGPQIVAESQWYMMPIRMQGNCRLHWEHDKLPPPRRGPSSETSHHQGHSQVKSVISCWPWLFTLTCAGVQAVDRGRTHEWPLKGLIEIDQVFGRGTVRRPTWTVLQPRGCLLQNVTPRLFWFISLINLHMNKTNKSLSSRDVTHKPCKSRNCNFQTNM